MEHEDRCTAPLASFQHQVESLAFSPDGKYIACGSRYEAVRLFSLEDGKLIRDIREDSRHESLFFTPDGRRLLVPSRRPSKNGGKEGFVRVWRSDLSKIVREFEIDDPVRANPNYTLAISSPDGSVYALSERYNRFHTRLFDAESGEVLLELPPHRDQVNDTAFSANGKMFAAAFNDGTIAYWTLDRSPAGHFLRPQRTHTIDSHRGKATSIEFVGNKWLVSSGSDGVVRSAAIATKQTPFLCGPPSRDIALSASGEFLAFAGQEKLSLGHVNSNAIIYEFESEDSHFNHVAISADDHWLAAACFNRLLVELRELDTGTLRQRLDFPMRVEDVAFAPHQDELAIITADGKITLFDCLNFHKTAEMKIESSNSGSNFCCAYSRSGKRLVCGGQLDELVVFDMDTLSKVREIPVNVQCDSLAFNASGTLLASGHSDGTIRLIQWPAGHVRQVMASHDSRVSSLSFSPNEKHLVSISIDGTTKIFSVKYARELGVFSRRSGGGSAVHFSADGKMIFASYCLSNPNEQSGTVAFSFPH